MGNNSSSPAPAAFGGSASPAYHTPCADGRSNWASPADRAAEEEEDQKGNSTGQSLHFDAYCTVSEYSRALGGSSGVPTEGSTSLGLGNFLQKTANTPTKFHEVFKGNAGAEYVEPPTRVDLLKKHMGAQKYYRELPSFDQQLAEMRMQRALSVPPFDNDAVVEMPDTIEEAAQQGKSEELEAERIFAEALFEDEDLLRAAIQSEQEGDHGALEDASEVGVAGTGDNATPKPISSSGVVAGEPGEHRNGGPVVEHDPLKGQQMQAQPDDDLRPSYNQLNHDGARSGAAVTEKTAQLRSVVSVQQRDSFLLQADDSEHKNSHLQGKRKQLLVDSVELVALRKRQKTSASSPSLEEVSTAGAGLAMIGPGPGGT